MAPPDLSQTVLFGALARPQVRGAPQSPSIDPMDIISTRLRQLRWMTHHRDLVEMVGIAGESPVSTSSCAVG